MSDNIVKNAAARAADLLAVQRGHIDNLDAILVYTLAERFKATQAVGKLKAEHELPPSDPAREDKQIARLQQLAIDADLNAGIIAEAEARESREIIRREADFFGAMDGASKFVRGDAVAGILITLINVIGGFAIGTLERGWPAGQTASVFTKLTIGDGLTSAMPSLIISIAAALIVTRSGSKADLGTDLTTQLGSQPRGLFITSAFLVILAATPLPTVPLVACAGKSAGETSTSRLDATL